MQEEVNEKTVSLCITGGKVTVRLLKQAMMRFLAAVEKEKAEKARKQQTKAPPDKEYHGKQSLKKLTQQNIQLSNIEITDGNIKTFERVARKYGVDFALKKDTTSQPPRYLVFFKSRDADALTAAFAEYSGKVVKRQSQEKPSVRRQLTQLQEVVRKMAQSLSRNKQQEVAR